MDFSLMKNTPVTIFMVVIPVKVKDGLPVLIDFFLRG